MDKAARHRTDVSTAVATDFSLVAHAAKRNADKVTLHRVRDGFHERRLAHARRANEAQDGRTAFRPGKLEHRDVFHDAFLHLVEPEVLGIEFALHLLHVENGVGVHAIRQVQEPVDIVAAHRIFGRGRLHHAHAIDFVLELFKNCRRELFRPDFLQQLVGFRGARAVTVQFVLQLANLLGNEPFLLLLGHLLAHVLLHAHEHVLVLVHHLHERDNVVGQLIDGTAFQEILAFAQRNLEEGDNAVKRIDLAVHGEQRIHHAVSDVVL